MSKYSIIIIEDNPDDYESFTRAFQLNGFNFPIIWYSNTEKYLSDFKNIDIPSLIILDLNLPGIDGRKVLEIIKSQEETKIIPVLIFTTSTDQEDIEICYKRGANSYVQKPLTFEEMKKVCFVIQKYWFDVAILPPPSYH